MEGKVKFFNKIKGFGFIIGDDGREFFVHHSAIAQGVFLRENDTVSFDPAEGDRGPQAKNVQLVKKASEKAAEESGSSENAEESEDAEEEY